MTNSDNRKKWWIYLAMNTIVLRMICTILLLVNATERPYDEYNYYWNSLDSQFYYAYEKMTSYFPMYLGLIVILLSIAVFVAYHYSLKEFAPKPGKTVKDASCFEKITEEKWLKQQQRKKVCKRIIIVVPIFVIVIFLVFVAYQVRKAIAKTPSYDKVGSFLTDDHVYGLAVYNNELYIPIDGDMKLYSTMDPMGYFAFKGEDCNGSIYRLLFANYAYVDSGDLDAIFMEVHGSDHNLFKKASVVEKEKDWQEDCFFALYDEDWIHQQAFSDGPAGYVECSWEFVKMLEDTFGEVTYRAEDFSKYDAYYTLGGYEDKGMLNAEVIIVPNWIGCIIVKNGHYYYGNLDNEITETVLEELKEILG